MSTAHAPAYPIDGHPQTRYRLYHEEKAKGGVGLTVIGGSTNVSPDSPSVFGQLYAGDDRIVPWFTEITDGVHQHGAAIMCQITHMGRRTAWDDGHWLPVLSPSRVREPAHRAVPKAMEHSDIGRVIEHFTKAALRCQAGGFDGIEILSHSHLLGQFLSPLVNLRDDEYGGSLENRMRLLMSVIAAVRTAVGNDFIVVTADDCLEIAKTLSASGHIDFINVLAGAPYDDLGLAGWVPPMGMPTAAHLSIAGQIRESVSIPVFHAGGVADIATARHAVSDGLVDLIGMTRAQIADPYLVRKLEANQESQIRPCVGLGYCVDRVNQGKDALCGHNAATGREATVPHIVSRADQRRLVVIIGAGAAGLEAARVSAERGHDTRLIEASDRLGGQLNLAQKGALRKSVAGVADWLISEVERLGVKVSLTQYADASDIQSLNPDVVIIATGGWPEPPAIEGGDLTVSSWDVLSGDVQLSGNVLLVDELGDQSGCVCADYLTQQGCEVQMVTPDRAIAYELGPTNSSVALRNLSLHGVTFETHQRLTAVELKGNQKLAQLTHVLTNQVSTRTVNHVVVEHGSTPMDSLYFDLKTDSINDGELDQEALIQGQSPFIRTKKPGQY